MTAVDSALIDQALEALGVHDVGPIGAAAGQKAVRHVRQGADDLV